MTRWIHKLSLRFRSLFKRARVEHELSDEVGFHLEQLAAEKVAQGMNAEEARYAALRELGGVDQIKEECRDLRGVNYIESFFQDVRYGLRMLGKKPAFTAVALIVIALGIGANTAIFTIVDAVLLRPLPYQHPDRLTVIWQSDPAHRKTGAVFDTYREFEEWHSASHSFEKLAVVTWANAQETLLWHGERQAVLAIPASLDFFSLLDVPASQGRTFEPGDLQNPCTVVLAYGFWQNRLGGQPGVVGENLTLGRNLCRVAGIMPKEFSFYPKQTDLWTLITPASDFVQHPWDAPVGVFGLLKPGVSRAAAEAELSALQKNIIHESPNWQNTNYMPDVLDLQWEFNWLTGRNLQTSLILLFAAVVVILLIACLNVAQLLLGRALERQKELAVRAALGSGRSRLIRQLLTESLLLSFCGAVGGTLIASGCVRTIRAASALDLPPGNSIAVDGRVLMFTALLAVLTGLLFGFLPAWRASRMDLNDMLKESNGGSPGGTMKHRAGRALVVAEVALSLVLLTWAGLLIESVSRLSSTPLGFRPDHLLITNLHLPSERYPQPQQRLRFYEQFMRDASALPDVEGVALSPQFGSDGNPLTVEGRASISNPVGPTVSEQSVSAGYFRVMGIPVLRGREFDTSDRENTLPVAVVNQSLAKSYFPDESPIGHRIRLGNSVEPKAWLSIVGVVGNVKSTTVFKEMGYVENPTVYRSLVQDPADRVSAFIRTEAGTSALAPVLRHEIANLDPLLPPPEVETMQQRLTQFRSQPQFRATLFSIFAGLALLLAAVGIYGVLSQSVTQRRREIGLRMALGARRADVLTLVLGEALKLSLAGVGIGLVGALMLTPFLASLLYGVRPADPLTFASISVLLTVVALLACYFPARRATQVDPMVALRHE